MDIAIRTVEEVSSVTGQPFLPGDRAWSFLFRNEDGLIDRLDCLESEREQVAIDGSVICSWGHRIKEKGISEAEEKRAALQSADEVFLSLYEDAPEGGSAEAALLDETRDRLKFFLALQLERKRILRPIGGQRYRHVPTKKEFVVPRIEITPEMISAFNEEIALMGGGPG